MVIVSLPAVSEYTQDVSKRIDPLTVIASSILKSKSTGSGDGSVVNV